MKLWFKLSAVMILIVSLGGLGAATLQSAKAKPFKPVAPLEVLMEGVDDYFLDFEDNIKDKKYKSMKKDALMLAEFFNIAFHHKTEKDWQKLSQEQIAQFQEFSEASAKKNDQALASLFKKIDATCEACHDKYRDN